MAPRVAAQPVGITERGRPKQRPDASPAAVSAEHLVVHAYREHGPALFNLVLAQTRGDRQLAEDIVQETMVRLWHHAVEHESTDIERLRPFLATVAQRLLIDSVRRRHVRPREIPMVDMDHAAMPDAIEPLLAQLTVRQALESLSEPHRDAIVQAFLMDRSTGEVAQTLRIPPATVRSRVHNALRIMRATLADRTATTLPLSA